MPRIIEWLAPCPARTKTKEGEWIYCTAGPWGHWGSHMGDRSEAEYKRLFDRYQQLPPTPTNISSEELRSRARHPTSQSTSQRKAT
jgi:hypothetical protein